MSMNISPPCIFQTFHGGTHVCNSLQMQCCFQLNILVGEGKFRGFHSALPAITASSLPGPLQRSCQVPSVSARGQLVHLGNWRNNCRMRPWTFGTVIQTWSITSIITHYHSSYEISKPCITKPWGFRSLDISLFCAQLL